MTCHNELEKVWLHLLRRTTGLHSSMSNFTMYLLFPIRSMESYSKRRLVKQWFWMYKRIGKYKGENVNN